MSKSRPGPHRRRVTVRGTVGVQDVTDALAAEQVDASRFWRRLTLEERLNLLHFEEAELLERVYEVQQELMRADATCYLMGIRGQDLILEQVGMNQFAMECSPETSRPIAFFPKQSFIERDDLLEFIDERLRLRQKASDRRLPRTEWLSVFQPTAKSWAAFMCQVLRLVELMVLEASRIELASASTTASGVTSASTAERRVVQEVDAEEAASRVAQAELEDALVAEEARAAKRRAAKERKRRNTEAARAEVLREQEEEREDALAVEALPSAEEGGEALNAILPSKTVDYCVAEVAAAAAEAEKPSASRRKGRAEEKGLLLTLEASISVAEPRTEVDVRTLHHQEASISVAEPRTEVDVRTLHHQEVHTADRRIPNMPNTLVSDDDLSKGRPRGGASTAGDKAKQKPKNIDEVVEVVPTRSSMGDGSSSVPGCTAFGEEIQLRFVTVPKKKKHSQVVVEGSEPSSSKQGKSSSSTSVIEEEVCSKSGSHSYPGSVAGELIEEPEVDNFLKFDWSGVGQPVDASVDTGLELQVDWSEAYIAETRWSAWLANGLTGNQAEWHWVDGSCRAVMKNSFIEVVGNAEVRVRTRSLPARLPRHGGARSRNH